MDFTRLYDNPEDAPATPTPLDHYFATNPRMGRKQAAEYGRTLDRIARNAGFDDRSHAMDNSSEDFQVYMFRAADRELFR